RRSVTRLSILLFAAASLLSVPLSAQATRLIDPLDPAYAEVEQLIDGGLIDCLTLAQKPLSRAAFSRAVSEAARNLARLTDQQGFPTLAGKPLRPGATRLRFYQELIASLRERLNLPDSLPVGGRLRPEVAPIRAIGVDLT